MASNSSGPSSPLNVAEAEQLAAQFRPVWDVDDAAPSNEPAAPLAAEAPVASAAPEAESAPAAVATPPVPKPTMRWAPGSGPQGFPAPAAPLPAPAPRNKVRAEAPTPELRELSGDEGQVSSDGAVAMAVVSAPVMPPKASFIAVREEPSIVVQDVAATARAIEDENESRRRQTVRVDELRHDPAVAAMYAKYESETREKEQEARAAKAAAAAPARPSARPAAAPLPDVEESYTPPTNKNRTIVLGAVGAAALIVVLGLAKSAFSSKDDAPTASTPATTATAATTTTAATTADKTQGASATATAAATAVELPKTAATATTTAPGKTAQAFNPSQLPPDNPSTGPVAKKDPPKTTAAPATAAAAPVAPKEKKPAGKGGIVREVPFLVRI